MSKLTDEIYGWDTKRVVQWLREQGMNDCERIFYQQRINGRALLNFQAYDITSLRVSEESKSKLQKCLQRYKQQKKNRFQKGDRRSFLSNNNEESSDDDHYQDPGFESDEFSDSEDEGGEYIEPDIDEEHVSERNSTESTAVPQGLVGKRLQQLRDSMKARGVSPRVQDSSPQPLAQNDHVHNSQDYDEEDEDDENIYDCPPDEIEEDTYEIPSDSSGGGVVVRPQPTSKDKIIRCNEEDETSEYLEMRESSCTYEMPDDLESKQGRGAGFIATRVEHEHAQYEIGVQDSSQDMYMAPNDEGELEEMYENPDSDPAKSPISAAPEEVYEVPDEETKQDAPPKRNPPVAPCEETYEVPDDEKTQNFQGIDSRGPTSQGTATRGFPQSPPSQMFNLRGSAFQGFQPRTPGSRPTPGFMPPLNQGQGPRGMSPLRPSPRGTSPHGPRPTETTPQRPGPNSTSLQGPGPRGKSPLGPGPRFMPPKGPSPNGTLPQGPGSRGVSPQGPGFRGTALKGTPTGPKGMLPPKPRPQEPPAVQRPGQRASQPHGFKSSAEEPSQGNIPPSRQGRPSSDVGFQPGPGAGARGPQKGPLPNPTGSPTPHPDRVPAVSRKGPVPLPSPGLPGRGGLVPPKGDLSHQQGKGPSPITKPKPKGDDCNRISPGGGRSLPLPVPNEKQLPPRIGSAPNKLPAELPQKQEQISKPESNMRPGAGRRSPQPPRSKFPPSPPDDEAPPPLPGPKPSKARKEQPPLPSPNLPSPPQFSTPPKETNNRPPSREVNLPSRPDTPGSRRDSTFSGSGDDPPLIPLSLLKNRLSGAPLPEKPQTTPDDQLKEAHWYHGDLDKTIAANCLKSCGKDGAFIVRNSSRTKGEFAMSLLCSGKVSHLRIPKKEGKFVLGDHGTEKFDSILDLVSFYRTNLVELKSGGSTKLTVAAQVFR